MRLLAILAAGFTRRVVTSDASDAVTALSRADFELVHPLPAGLPMFKRKDEMTDKNSWEGPAVAQTMEAETSSEFDQPWSIEFVKPSSGANGRPNKPNQQPKHGGHHDHHHHGKDHHHQNGHHHHHGPHAPDDEVHDWNPSLRGSSNWSMPSTAVLPMPPQKMFSNEREARDADDEARDARRGARSRRHKGPHGGPHGGPYGGPHGGPGSRTSVWLVVLTSVLALTGGFLSGWVARGRKERRTASAAVGGTISVAETAYTPLNPPTATSQTVA